MVRALHTAVALATDINTPPSSGPAVTWLSPRTEVSTSILGFGQCRGRSRRMVQLGRRGRHVAPRRGCRAGVPIERTKTWERAGSIAAGAVDCGVAGRLAVTQGPVLFDRCRSSATLRGAHGIDRLSWHRTDPVARMSMRAPSVGVASGSVFFGIWPNGISCGDSTLVTAGGDEYRGLCRDAIYSYVELQVWSMDCE